MRFFHPLILFLDEDTAVSASYLSERFLLDNIKNTCQVLICANLYMVGIRNKKICKWLFSKERKSESLNKYFMNWPLKTPPSFVKYTSEESKWCRKCKNHYDVVLDYFEALLNEYTYRHCKDHPLYEMLDYLKTIQYENSVRLGLKVVYVPNLKICLPWKNLPLKYRKKDVIKGYREYYKSLIYNPYEEYSMTKRDIPDFVLEGRDIGEFSPTPIN